MVSRKVPLNAFHIQCGNCNIVFAYKDVSVLPLRACGALRVCHFFSAAQTVGTLIVPLLSPRRRWRSTTSA
jgi:hypothetical protein